MSHPPSSNPTGEALWKEVFENENPVFVEIGPGRGESLLQSARLQHNYNFYGIERSRRRVLEIQTKLESAAIKNARVINADATCLIRLLPDSCVAGYVIQFPDPWWKRRHHRRRLFTEPFVADMARTLVPGATIELITDVEEYFAMAQQLLNARDDLESSPSTPSQGDARTSFARKAHKRSAHIYASVHRRLPRRA